RQPSWPQTPAHLPNIPAQPLTNPKMQTIRASRAVSVNVRASAKPTVSKPMAKLAQLAGVAVSSLALTLAAHADANVKLGSSTGALVFEPETVTISAGESVTFVNNAGFPHNIVFDEDAVPAGVSVDAISREDYMNAPGETYTVKLDTAGEYGFYCEPHQGASLCGPGFELHAMRSPVLEWWARSSSSRLAWC
ncbi:hypothetical protein QJQ45_028098, partial [Haematococcus lacustris]